MTVHENAGVLVKNDTVALRTLLSGTHGGDYAGIAATGNRVDTSISHFLWVRDDVIVAHWTVTDSYRLLAQVGAVPRVGGAFQSMLRLPEAADGIWVERLGTPFGPTPRHTCTPRRNALWFCTATTV